MIKKIIVSLCFVFSVSALAQQSSSSPYSFFGIGEIKFKGTVENRSMGSLSVIPDSIHVNLQNPASYSNLRLTNYAIGGSYTTNTLKTTTQKENTQRTTIDYLSIAIPTKKIGLGIGLIPYSSVGYNLSSISNTEAHEYKGTGGINKAYLAASYKLSDNFSVGAEMQYNFGQIETRSIYSVYGVQYSTREINTSNATGMNLVTGVFYQRKLNNKVQLFSSATFTPEATLKLKNSRSIATIQVGSTGGESLIDSATDITVPDTKMKLPTKYSFGVGVGELKKWAIGAEVTLVDNANFSNRFADISSTYKNGNKINFGGYYIPKYNAYSNFFKKVVYRGGLRFENTGLVINNQTVNDKAVTAGIGLPVRGSFSNVNIGFEYGSRGTVSSNLIKENYFTVSFALSFNDKWFTKRKYD